MTVTGASPERPSAAALGLFDGVHKGHRAVISKAASIARDENLAPAVFTFDIENVDYKGGGGLILSRRDKFSEISSLGTEYIYSPPFEEIKELSPESFVKEILKKKLRAERVVCGEDFRFGKNASGDFKTLEKLCAQCGIRTAAVPPVEAENGARVSSTEIRKLISAGEIAKANDMLGYNYYLISPVAEGRRIGRTLDFPTVNQYFPEGLALPKFGVYASRAEFDGKIYKGVTNIGVKPTVSDGNMPSAETFINDFEGDLYGREIKISLFSFIRPERKFSSLQELAEQIRKDTAAALNI